MANKNNNKQKRGSLLWAGLLSFGLAALALVLGFYVGIMTINFGYGEFKNAGEYGFANNVGNLGNYAGFGNDYGNAYDSYVDYENFGAFPSNANTGAWGRASVVGSTIGAISAMNHGTIYLFVCAGLMIVLGSVGVTVAFKLLRLTKSTNFVFYTKKGIVISSLVFFGVTALVGVASIVFGLWAFSGTGQAGTTLMLSGVAIGLSVLCFVLVFKEYKKFMKKIKRGEVVIEIEYPKRYVPAREAGNMAYAARKYSGTGIDIDSFQRELVRLDEMRGKGLINDQEYQQLKTHWINKMNNKIF